MTQLGLLLDDGRLEGPQTLDRVVGPCRVAAVADRNDPSDGRAAVEDLCMTWGGACGALLPAARGEDLSDRWTEFLATGEFDQLAHRGVAATDPHRRGVFVVQDVSGEPLLANLWGQREPSDWPICDCSLPAEDDPWFIAYLACVGAWPLHPSARQLSPAGLVDDYRFDQMLRVDRDVLIGTGPVDLVARLRRRDYTYPAQLSCHGLSLWSLPQASHLNDAPVLPRPGWERSRYGANLVVVYEPGSVEDLALIWNLRAAHGVSASVPLAIPATVDVAAALREWSTVGSEAWALRLFGLVSRPWGLISATIDKQRLERWAEQASLSWAAADADTVAPGHRPARPSKDVAVFREGRARIAAVAADDREFFRHRPATANDPEIRVRITPAESRHPEPSLAGLPPHPMGLSRRRE